MIANFSRKSAARIAPRIKPIAELLSRLSLTRLNARLGLVFDAAVALALLGAGLWTNTSGPFAAAAVIAIGLFLFSGVEYAFHRWLFHGKPNSARDGHNKHHVDPQGYGALPFFLPPLGMLALARLLALVVPVSTALLLSGALAAGYAIYGITHTIIHTVRFRLPIATRWAASHHIHHHHPDCNFGVTTPLWDIILATRYCPSKAGARTPSRPGNT